MNTLILVLLIGLLAVNRLVLTLLGYGGSRYLFWSIQFLNLGAVIAVILVGLPNIPPGLKIINYFIALVFMLHIVENNSKRVKAIKEFLEREKEKDLQKERKDLIRERIYRGEALNQPKSNQGIDKNNPPVRIVE